MDSVNEPVNEETIDAEEYCEFSVFVETNDAVGFDSTQSKNEEKSRNGIGENSSADLPPAVPQETQPDQESSIGFDADELEMEEDDITSKLLSIQVLPRIPKRKPVTDSSTTASVGETSSYCSVLERVNSASSSVGARYPNWSAAGWSRSNIDRPLRQWSRQNTRDRNVESKPQPVKREVSEKPTIYDAKQMTEVVSNKTKRAAEHSAWSPDATDVSGCSGFSEIEQIAADDRTAPTLSGPLPTLPFEEQMRERARLRNLKKGSVDVANSSSDAAETVLKNFESSDNSKYRSDGSNFLSDKADNSKPPVSEARDVNLLTFTNSTALFQTDSAERRRLAQHRPSENGHSHDHMANRPNHRTNRTFAEDHAHRLPFTGIRETKPAKSSGDEPIPKSKKEPTSPPLPHLPVLPLFATSSSETGDSSLHRMEKKITTSGKTSTTLSSSGNDVHSAGSLNVTKLKLPTSATSSAVTKSVTFDCNTEVRGGAEAKRKSKSKVG